jgi:WD40 repeat protein/predicted Ser/Thr protein kinase
MATPAPPSGHDEHDPLERRIEEFLRRRRAGQAVEIDAFAAEHPDQAEEIRALFPLLIPLEADLAPTPARPRERFGRWSVVRELGRGGMGVVYLAEDAATGERAALKLMSDDHPHALVRFRREAAALARVDHPGICRVLEASAEAPPHWIAMEYVEGETLAEAIRRARQEAAAAAEGPPFPRDPDRWLGLGALAADALHAAHEAGLVHRDVKPGNLMLTADDRAVVLDFGLAAEDRDDERTRLTQTGVPIGTPAYMSPEQVRAGSAPPDRRTDVYSLGAALYEALTLEPPFSGPTIASLFSQILTADPESPRRRNPRLSADVDAVLTTALEKDPARRYATARHLAEDLRAARRGLRVRARRPGPVRRLTTWVRRHPVLAAAGAAVALALATGLVVALVLLARVTEARDREAAVARRARARALAAASADAQRVDAMRALLLAEEAVRTARLDETVTRLHAAVYDSLEQVRLEGHEGPVGSIAWDAAGRWIATGAGDGRARLFARGGELQRTFPPVEEAASGHVRVVLSPDGTRLLAHSEDGAVRLWGADGTLVAHVAAAARPAGEALFLSDGTACVVGADGWIALHGSDGSLGAAFDVPGREGRGRVIAAAAEDDPPRLHVLTADHVAIAYDPEGRETGRREQARAASVARVFEGGRLALVVPRDEVLPGDPAGEVLRVLAADGTAAGTLLGHYSGEVALAGCPRWWFAWSAHSGATLVEAAGASGLARPLDLQRSERPFLARATRDGSRLFTARASPEVRTGPGASTAPLILWSPRAAPIAAIAAGEHPLASAAFSPDGEAIALGAHAGGVVTIHRTTPAELATVVPRWRGAGYRYPAAPTASGACFAAFADEAHLCVVREDGTERARFPLEDPESTFSSLHPVRELLLVTGRAGAAAVHDLDGVVRLRVLPVPPIRRAVWVGGEGGFAAAVEGGSVRFHAPDGGLLAERAGAMLSPEPFRAYPEEIAVAAADRVLVCAPGGEVLREVAVPPGARPFWYHGSPSGRSILLFETGLVAVSICYLDERGQTRWEAALSGIGHRSGALSPDARRVAFHTAGGLSLRDETGTELARLAIGGGVAHHAFDGGGTRLAASSGDGTLRVWDRDGVLLFDLPDHGGPAFLAFSADGRRLLTVTAPLVRLFTTDVDELLALAATRQTRPLGPGERLRYADLLAPAR